MGEPIQSQTINLKLLNKFHTTYQTDLNELINLYLEDSKKKFEQLYKYLEMGKFKEFLSAARELRIRSLDVGAVHFSHACISLEIAASERRTKSLATIIRHLEEQFAQIQGELKDIKSRLVRPIAHLK